MRVLDTMPAARALAELRDALEKSARALEAELRKLESEDGTEATELRATVLALLDHESRMLLRVRRAEERLRQGLYGTCALCGRPLEEWQLRATPEAELCTACRASANE